MSCKIPYKFLPEPRSGQLYFIGRSSDMDIPPTESMVDKVRRASATLNARACAIWDAGEVNTQRAEAMLTWARELDVRLQRDGVTHIELVRLLSKIQWELSDTNLIL